MVRTLDDFYPRPPRGGRLIALLSLRMDSLNFYPRPPRGGRPGAAAPVLVVVDFYPRPPRGGRRRGLFIKTYGIAISIHALREEGDPYPLGLTDQQQNFYPRPPRGGRHKFPVAPHPTVYFYPRPPRGGRLRMPAFLFAVTAFLSTPSARRATWVCVSFFVAGQNFYPRPPRGGRLYKDDGLYFNGKISIHALREEGDPGREPHTWPGHSDFYPRPPRGGRPCIRSWASNLMRQISIHALREEGDPLSLGSLKAPNHISIHALREEGDLLERGEPL